MDFAVSSYRFMLLVAVLLYCLSACTTTTIHLYTEGMDADSLNSVEAALQKDGFSVERNARPVPREITRPTLVYAPEHSHPKQLDTLDANLVEQGFDLRWVPISIGNNYYTRNNIGLYPVPYSAISHSEADVTTPYNNWFSDNDFVSNCEEVEAWLKLAADRSFQLDQYEQESNAGRNAISSITGSWQEEGNRILLQNDNETIVFEKEEETSQILFRGEQIPLRAMHLRNQGEVLEGCDFVFRETISL